MKKVFILEDRFSEKCEILISQYNNALINLYLKGNSTAINKELVERKNEEVKEFLMKYMDIHSDIDVMKIKKIYPEDSRVAQLLNSNIIKGEELIELIGLLQDSKIPMVIELTNKLLYANKNNMIVVFYFK